MVWGIPQERLDGLVTPRDDSMFPAGIGGLGSVVRRNDQLIVFARAKNLQLLAKELIKGTVELICLHGLNQLSDDLYQRVIHVTDRFDIEPWMIQSGGELWRRLLAALPDDRPIAHVLMHLARTPAGRLESVLAQVIEQSEGASHHLAALIKSAEHES